tara:strand:- start:401 stop:4108 length:3708 start_codon:yes stop_codon:yes gene_type:complete
MAFYNNVIAGAAGASGSSYKIERSLRLNDSDSAHLTKTFSAGNSQKWTWAGWVKRNKLGGYQTLFGHVSGGSGQHYIDFGGDKIRFTRYVSSNEAALETSALYRDTAAWMHVCAIWDVGNSTANHRQRLFVNGLEVTEFSTRTNPSQNYTGGVISTAIEHHIGKVLSQNYGAFQLADVHFLDGIVAGISTDDASGSVTGTPNAAYLTDFGEFDAKTGVWNPIEYEGSYSGPAVAATSFANATGATPLYNTTNEGQTLGSGYVSGATSNAKIIIPGYNNTEEGTSMNISNSGTNVVTESKWYGNSIQFSRVTATNTGNDTRYLTYNSGLGLSGASYYTIEAWVYPRSGSNGWNILFEGDWNTNSGLLVSINGNNNLTHYLGNGSFQTFISNFTVPTDTWSHVAVVCDNNTIKMFLNGSMETKGTRTKNYNLSNHYKLIGAYADSNYTNHGGAVRNGFYGYMQDIRVTTTAKYQSSFLAPGSGGIPAGVNGFRLDFSDNSSNAALGEDSSGNGNDFTVNNLVAIAQSVSVSDVTVYRDGAVYALGNPGHMFDSSKSTITYAGSNNATNYIDWSPAGGYETSGHIWIQGGNGSGGGADSMTVTINGSTVTRTAVVDNETYGSPSYGYGDWHKYTVSGNTLNSLRLTGAYALIRQLSTVDDPTHSVLGISDDNDVPIIENVDPADLDVLFDAPTNGTQSDTGAGGEVSGNYCVLNPLAKGSNVTLSNGNLEASSTTGSGTGTVLGTIGVSSGKWYWEFTGGSGALGVGVGIAEGGKNLGTYLGEGVGYSYYSENGRKYSSAGGATYGASYGANDVIGVALDADAGTLVFYKNGSSQGTAFTGLTNGPYFPAIADSSGTNSFDGVVNFGQRSFTHSAPSNHKCLCTTNLPTPTIADGSAHFDALLYTGDGQSSKAVTGYGFSPDFLWIKERSSSSDHGLWNTVVGSGKYMSSNTNASEYTTTIELSSIDSAGFTVGSSGMTNQSSQTYVAWAWDAGSSTVSNTDGSITSNVRANQSAGFSIVSYTGNGSSASIGHGLNDAPQMIILKDRNASAKWKVLHIGAVSGSYAYYQNVLHLNTNETFTGTGNNYPWGGTAPTSTVFSVGNIGTEANRSGSISGTNYIAYCFAPVEGYSAFGSYTGDSSGPFVFTGHSPAWVMIKRTDSSNSWVIYDTARDTYNIGGRRLYAEVSDSEGQNTSHHIDILSNGFKVRSPAGNLLNASNGTYIWASFASSPFKTARAR